MSKDKIESAKKRLEHLRHGVDFMYKVDLKMLDEGVREGDFTLEEIGTDLEELERLRVKNCRALAREWLKRLRSGQWVEHYELGLKILDEGVQIGHRDFTLLEIGTDLEELERLRVKNCKALVLKRLEHLRSRMIESKEILASLLEEVRKSGSSLEDFGTSQKKLEGLWSITVQDEE